MISEARDEFDARYDGRARKIREAVAAAIKEELTLFRSSGPVTQDALDAEVARIAREKLHPRGSEVVVHRTGDNLTRLLIKIRRGEVGYAQVEKFLRRDNGSSSQTKA